ncbi:hypothetical protein BDZ89DRAFT_1085641 [Hymenopellis radicata]|nr:hypothetical protein BDZ89DRAFT_1085641 [Hymenopellis radicata]
MAGKSQRRDIHSCSLVWRLSSINTAQNVGYMLMLSSPMFICPGRLLERPNSPNGSAFTENRSSGPLALLHETGSTLIAG